MARPKYYSEDRKYIPYTKSTYIRSPYSRKWILENILFLCFAEIIHYVIGMVIIFHVYSITLFYWRKI